MAKQGYTIRLDSDNVISGLRQFGTDSPTDLFTFLLDEYLGVGKQKEFADMVAVTTVALIKSMSVSEVLEKTKDIPKEQKTGDINEPKENTARFYMKYGAMTFAELKDKK